jgi:hypothetical protein
MKVPRLNQSERVPGLHQCNKRHSMSAQEGRDDAIAPLLSWELFCLATHNQLQPLVAPQPSQT